MPGLINALNGVQQAPASMFPQQPQQPQGMPMVGGMPQQINSPLELPESQQKKLVSRLKKIRDYGVRNISELYSAWNQAEAQYVAYVGDEYRATGRKVSSKNPYAKRIFIPYTMANVQSMLAYLLQVFASQRPYFELEARGQNVKETARMTAVMDSQADVINLFLKLYSFFLDGMKFGVGIMQPLWERRMTTVRVPAPLNQVMGEWSTEVDFEGPMTRSIDPFRYVQDPMAPLGDVQAGEFAGTWHNRSYQHLKKMEAAGVYFGVDRIKDTSNAGFGAYTTHGTTFSDDPQRDIYRGLSQRTDDNKPAGVGTDGVRAWGRLDELWVKLIPSEWGVGTAESEEVWVFAWHEDKTLLRCHKSPYIHKRLPFVTWEPNYDPHSWWNPGIPWLTQGLQDNLNWLFNSQMEDVRLALNGMLVVDPFKIEINDILRPQPGRFIRKKGEWQGPLDQAYSQLKHQQVTGRHGELAQQVMEYWQRTTAVGDNQMGLVNPEKRTASEARIAASGAQGRMSMMAKLASAQGIMPLVQMWVLNNQQLLSASREYRVVGEQERYRDLADQIQNGRIHVNPPYDIAGPMDIMVHDGTLPVDPAQNAGEWQQIFSQVVANPILMQQFNVTSIFKEWIQSLPGKKRNIDDFLLQQGGMPTSMQMVPDDLNQVPDNARPVPIGANYG